MSGGVDPLSLIKRFSDDERNLASVLFLAPYVPGGKIKVKLKSVVYDLTVTDAGPLAEHGGFGLFQMTEPGKARYVEAPKREMTDAYLKLLPRVAIVLIEEFETHWWGLQANPSDTRFMFREPVPLRLPERPLSFQQVYARFDGNTFWYHGENRRRDPVVARKLREAIGEDLSPDALRISGANPSELLAYRVIYFDKHPELAPPKPQETPVQARHQLQARPRTDLDRLRDALTHAGARLDGYWATGDGSSSVFVRYSVDGHNHTATVNLDDLSVMSAGICLSGRDRDFDLTSLVGVMREYHGNHRY